MPSTMRLSGDQETGVSRGCRGDEAIALTPPSSGGYDATALRSSTLKRTGDWLICLDEGSAIVKPKTALPSVNIKVRPLELWPSARRHPSGCRHRRVPPASFARALFATYCRRRRSHHHGQVRSV
jgi:hypothetical protein